jgi:hypothetical protein
MEYWSIKKEDIKPSAISPILQYSYLSRRSFSEDGHSEVQGEPFIAAIYGGSTRGGCFVLPGVALIIRIWKIFEKKREKFIRPDSKRLKIFPHSGYLGFYRQRR